MSETAPAQGAPASRPSISIVDHIVVDDEGRALTEPLREDIRLLGGILGEVVAEHSGTDVFDLVESARVAAFGVRRNEIDRSELADMFVDLDVTTAVPVIRAFSHFALLANLAEDIHRERRRAIHVRAGDPPQKSSLAATYRQLADAGLGDEEVGRALADANVVPVITAHPTETRRRTVFEAQNRITELMRFRGRTELTPDEDAEVTEAIRRQILTLWQTALIRLERLTIQDEIRSGLRYYDASFFDVVPAINTSVRAALRSAYPEAGLADEPMIRMGSWIGGDRDGNPFVTAEVVALAATLAAETAVGHHLAELENLAQELSMSARLITGTEPLLELAGADADDPGADEPFRLALRHIRSRLATTTRRNSSPTWTSSTPRCGSTTTPPSPTTASSPSGSRCAPSVSICPDSTCGRTPTCTRRSSPNSWRGPACTPTTPRWARRSASRSCPPSCSAAGR